MATCAKPTRSATASYIEAMLVELRKMGDEMDADFLVYLLEMALIEASDLAERPTEDPFQRLRTKNPGAGDLRPPGTL